ncbi:MAG: hypothetical protein EP298_06290 [Gammaproteobacteria bacterium]|nr:MAG: hypothetical protein EP298_06290 [Gammaproteobacteria bacterium]UTW41569.1 hypothetical protein KFE69_08615 [bacterium SCSIO 12844]
MKSSLEKNSASVKFINKLLDRVKELGVPEVTYLNVYNVLSDMIYLQYFGQDELAKIFDDKSFNKIKDKVGLHNQCRIKVKALFISSEVYKILENLNDGDSINSNTIRSIGNAYRQVLMLENKFDEGKLTIAVNLSKYDTRNTKTSNECVNDLIKQLSKIKNHDFFSIVSTDILNEVLGCDVKNTNKEGEQVNPKLLACEFKYELDKQNNGNTGKNKNSYLFWNRNNPPKPVEYSLHNEL